MTLQELLDAKDKAIDTVATAVEGLAEARAGLESAQAEVADTEKTLADANAAESAAHKALHDCLEDKGHHYMVADDGTVTIYHAIEEPPGWCCYQPVPGITSKSKGHKIKTI